MGRPSKAARVSPGGHRIEGRPVHDKRTVQVGLLIVFKKESLNDPFLFRFSIVFKKHRFVFGKNDSFYYDPLVLYF